MLYMPKLKTTSLFKVLISLVIIWCIFNLFFVKHESILNGGETSLEGHVLDYEFNGDLLKLTIKAKEKVVVNYYLKTEEEKKELEKTLGFNDYLIFKGKLEVPLGNDIPNVFSYQKYLEHHHIYYLFKASNLKRYPNQNIFFKLKNWCYKRLDNINNNEYLKALLLGVKDGIDNELFRENGLSHLFAISGMHISLFILILSKSKYLKKPKITLIFLWFYTFLVGFTPSILRSVIFYTIKIFNNKLKITNIQILMLVICLMLFINPFYLYDIGFIYSFVISFGLLTYHFDKENKIKDLLKTSTFIFFITLPITAINFYKVNFLTILFNLIAIPLVSTIIYPLALLTFILPIFNIIFEGFTTLFVFLNKIAENIKLGILILPKVNIILWIIYFYLFYKAFYYHNKNYFKILICFLFLIHFLPFITTKLNITYLSVGQGDSSLLVSNNLSNVILIDTGGIYNYENQDWAKRKNINYTVNNIVSYLNSLGINKIDNLILTHGDYDHAGNTIYLLNKIKIKKVIFNNDDFNDLESNIIKELDKRKIKYERGTKDLKFDKGQLQFLNTKKYNNENDNSNVIYFNYLNYQFLFMGDAGIEKENDLLKKYNLKNITFLKVGHHGSDTSSGKYFIGKIKPKYSIISVGKNNRYGHPKDRVLKNLENSKIYRTDKDGSIIVKFNNDSYHIVTVN